MFERGCLRVDVGSAGVVAVVVIGVGRPPGGESLRSGTEKQWWKGRWRGDHCAVGNVYYYQ